MHDLVDKARRFAITAHGRLDQRRKYSSEPYPVHLQAVADLVASVSDDPEMIAAAWLHDTVEDTPTTEAELTGQFGEAVARLVMELTDVSRPADGNRAVRKSVDRGHLAQASSRAKTIKLADLIHNCRDICSHDSEFAKIYLTEMAALLEVLRDGDATLYSQAMAVFQENAAILRLSLHIAGARSEDNPSGEGPLFPLRRMAQQFRQTFIARQIARALPSVDHPEEETVRAIMERHRLPVVGVREQGVVCSYVTGEAPLHIRPILPEQTVADRASFAEVILVLGTFDCCFVTLFDTIAGVLVKADIQHPYMRMWLFGIVTMVEMETGPLIERFWPNGGWQSLISEGRLAKAQLLLAERERRNQPSTLLACLQFADKLQILLENETFFRQFGFSSKKVARSICKDIESLRNNLAHAQDIVSHDFAQVARIAHRIESLRDG
jgi:hypothetical protein